MDNQKLRIAVYNYRDFDEAQFFTKFAGTYNAEYVIIRESPSPENARLAEGCQGVTVITTAITEEIIRIWKEVGGDHPDLEGGRSKTYLHPHHRIRSR